MPAMNCSSSASGGTGAGVHKGAMEAGRAGVDTRGVWVAVAIGNGIEVSVGVADVTSEDTSAVAKATGESNVGGGVGRLACTMDRIKIVRMLKFVNARPSKIAFCRLGNVENFNHKAWPISSSL